MKRNYWQKITEKTASSVVLAVFTLLAYAEVYYFVSGSFFETNKALFGYAFLSVLLIAVLAGLTLFFGVSLFLSLYHKEVMRYGTLTFAAELFTLAIGAALPIIFYYARTVETAVFLKTLPYFLAGLAAMLFLFLIPLTKKKWYFAFIALAISVGAVCGFSALSANGEKISFEADPVVFDNGDGFSVVWCTDANSVGYLEYTYEGQKHIVYDQADGRYRADSRVHTVCIPYEHLYGNSYTVSSAKVLKNASRDCKIGSFITSKEYAFSSKVSGDELKMLSLTDWHEKTDRACELAAMRADYDLLLMMGDEINYVNEFDDILNSVVIPGGKLTAGVKPVLFVRGNHEIRGKYADRLKAVLGMKNYFYTASYGEVNFLVFDGGDTKPDDDPEHGIVNVCEAYREEQLAKMEALPVITTGYNVCLCHIPLFSREILDAEPKAPKADEQQARFTAILTKQEVKLEISGHEHYLEYMEGGDYDILIAGGPTKTDGYVACLISVKAGVATIEAYNAKGTVATYGPLALR